MEELRIRNWYQDDQIKNQYENLACKHVIEKRWAIFEKIICAQIEIKDLARPLELLDLGAGDGVNFLFLSQIKTKYHLDINFSALDNNAFRLSKLRKRFPDVNVIYSDLVDNFSQSGKSYDIILFNHVLEHIARDGEALENITTMLNDDGTCILGVPNEGCALASLRNHVFQPSILKTTDHINFYHYQSLSNLINQSNLNLTQFYRNGFFYPHLRLHAMMNQNMIGQAISRLMLKVFPSQAAELILVLNKS